MFIKILLLSIVTGIVGINTPFNVEKTVKYDEVVTTESIKQRNYQHSDWLNNNTEVIYKYETNEVSSYDDLVIGNIYNYQPNPDAVPNYYSSLRFTAIYNLSGFDISVEDNDIYTSFYFYIGNNLTTVYIYGILDNGSVQQVLAINQSSFEDSYTYADFVNDTFQLVLLSTSNQNIQCFSMTQFNVIESVIYHQPTTIIGYINEFFEENLLGEIPFIRDINFEIGGQNINLLTWVIMAIGLVIVGLLIFAFIKLIIWLVKLFSNSFLLR